jgi:hypothetical protein
LASKFFDCRRQKGAGILYVFQGFLAKAGEKFAVKMRAAAIGTASLLKCRLAFCTALWYTGTNGIKRSPPATGGIERSASP